MKNYDKRNIYFDQLNNQEDLKWFGQNTNHFESHKYVIDEMVNSIKKQEFNKYAPPLGLEELRNLILDHLSLSLFLSFKLKKKVLLLIQLSEKFMALKQSDYMLGFVLMEFIQRISLN